MSIYQAFKRASQMGNNRKSISLTETDENKLKHDQETVEKFLTQKDVPPWHRGVSAMQTVAATKLMNALRDDTEQRTTHRVRACISQIGLEPPISCRQTRILMRLSRGNDMAFLWFLMEVHYKTPGPEYTLNEQLIMSSISHLDMITTLRELDRLLPPGHPPLFEIKRQERIDAMHEKQKRKAKRQRKGDTSKTVLPYFKPLERPQNYGKSLYIPVPSFTVKFGPYENYNNPAHIVQNEANRWYKDYDLAPSRRIVKRILNEELENLFRDYSAATLKGESLKPMCDHHREILALEESLKNKLRVIARERCLKMLDMDAQKKEALQKRIMDQLEQEIGKYVCKFHKIAGKSEKQCRVKILANECTGYDLKLVDDNDENSNDNELSDELCTPRRPSGLLEQHESIDVNRDFRRESGGNIYMLSEKKRSCPEKKAEPCGTELSLDDRIDVEKDDMLSHDDSSQSHSDSLIDPPKNKERVSFSTEAPRVCPPKSVHNYNYGHSESRTPTESQTFFKTPRNNKPYQFDYQKIFRFKNMDEKPNVRETFVNALNSQMDLNASEPNKPQKQQQKMQSPEDESHRPNISDAISKCVCKIWKDQVAIKNIELEEEAERKRNLPGVWTSPLDYEQKYYNPNDRALMSKMLKDAMEYMSKNPKFVLASMPDSYKLPVLREWIARRYGKVYSQMERIKLLKVSLKIFNALDKIHVKVPMPTTKELGNNLNIDYTCHDYLIRKSKKVKKDYYQRLNAFTMDYTRIFWFATQPYFCSGGPPRNTFFAYMPSHITNIKRFRIWKSDEFVNMKSHWEKRLASKTKQHS